MGACDSRLKLYRLQLQATLLLCVPVALCALDISQPHHALKYRFLGVGASQSHLRHSASVLSCLSDEVDIDYSLVSPRHSRNLYTPAHSPPQELAQVQRKLRSD